MSPLTSRSDCQKAPVALSAPGPRLAPPMLTMRKVKNI